MADFEFVDPTTGAVLGPIAMGIVAAGTVSATRAARLRYKWGQSGSGVPANALCLRLSEDGGATWRTDLRQFTVSITAVTNVPADPLYTESIRSLGKGYRFRLAPLRAGCAVDLGITFTPDLRPGGGATQTDYIWEAGLDFEQWEEIALVPDAPSGILTGLGDVTVSEWVTAPTLANGTGKVTFGAWDLVHRGVALSGAGGDVTLSQTSISGALTSGQEYIAVLTVTPAGAVVVSKGGRAAAGSAVQPSYPAANQPLAVVIVPYGGVITSSTLVAVSGQCAVTDTGGLTYSVQPGRAVTPGMLATPATMQTGTLPDNATSTVYLSPSGLANLTAGIPLKQFTTVAGDITAETDLRPMLYGGAAPLLLADLDCDGHTISNGFLSGMALSGGLDADGQTITDPVLTGATLGGTLAGGAQTVENIRLGANVVLDATLDAAGQRITGLGLFYVGTDASDAASVGSLRGAPVKFPVLCMGDPEVVWDDIVSNGAFATDLTDWTGTNWAWDTGSALHTAGATDPLSQSRTIVSGVRYKLTFSVGGAAGTLTPSIGAVAGTPVAAGAGVTEQIIIAGASGTLALAFTPSSDFDGNLDDVFCTATLFGLPTMDGATPAAGDRVLLPMQSDPAECGKWIVSDTGPWVRHPDCLDHYYLFAGAEVWVRAGTTWAKSKWIQTATISNIETDTQVWELAYQIP